ncbi:MAG TPA: prepilin-type N-terminal cleavage/methylation domain-containing protein [Candidatus Manganitrophaceae bacterium]|nr:prepilin-type N-terminal cleavage/methylation domain-containing protein [Candidatus Manganitrophaceae bacterium]
MSIKGGRGQRGFTLIEIMVALAVLSIALVVLLGLRNRDLALAAYSRHLTEATLLARQKIGEISLAGFPDLGEREGDFADAAPGYRDLRGMVFGRTEYRWREEVKQTPYPYDVVRELSLTVVWSEGGREETARFTTYLFNVK